jgi:hypothetical protein
MVISAREALPKFDALQEQVSRMRSKWQAKRQE